MTYLLILLLVLAAVAVMAETLRETFHDGPTRRRPPRSHAEDPRFLPPATRLC